jgi:hypothetical protein
MSGFGERLTYALPRTAWNTVHVSIVTHSRVTVPVSKILNLGVNLPSPPGAWHLPTERPAHLGCSDTRFGYAAWHARLNRGAVRRFRPLRSWE